MNSLDAINRTPYLQASAATPWRPARQQSGQQNGQDGAHPMKGNGLHPNHSNNLWEMRGNPNWQKAFENLTSFICSSKLWMAKFPTVFLSIIHLPSFQVIEQFPCPKKFQFFPTFNVHVLCLIKQKNLRKFTYRGCCLGIPNQGQELVHPSSLPQQSRTNLRVSATIAASQDPT